MGRLPGGGGVGSFFSLLAVVGGSTSFGRVAILAGCHIDDDPAVGSSWEEVPKVMLYSFP